MKARKMNRTREKLNTPANDDKVTAPLTNINLLTPSRNLLAWELLRAVVGAVVITGVCFLLTGGLS